MPEKSIVYFEDQMEEQFANYKFTITLGVADIIKWMEDNSVEKTYENVEFIVKTGVLEDTYHALDNQVSSELEHIAQEKIGDPEKIGDDSVFICDDPDCNTVLDMRENEDLSFEVPDKYAMGKTPGIGVCEKCWIEKGYAQIYYGYRELVESGVIEEE